MQEAKSFRHPLKRADRCWSTPYRPVAIWRLPDLRRVIVDLWDAMISKSNTTLGAQIYTNRKGRYNPLLPSDLSRAQTCTMVYGDHALHRHKGRTADIQGNAGHCLWGRFGCRSCQEVVNGDNQPPQMSGFTSIAFFMFGYGGKAAEVWAQGFASRRRATFPRLRAPSTRSS